MSQGRRMADTSKKRKSKEGKLSLPFTIMAIVYLIITIIFYISVIKMNLLPGLYITIFTIAEIIFTISMLIGIAKRHKTLKLNVLCTIIAVILSVVYIYAINYTNATTDFLGNVFKEVKETEEYYVVVKKDSNYSKIEELNNKNIYLFKAEEDVKQEINKKVSVKYETKNSLKDLGDELIKGKEEAILISSTQYEILGEEIENFKANTKIIYTAQHEVKVNAKVENLNSKYTVQNGIFNVYISGIDTSGSIGKVSRSDANIVATINMKTHEVLLTSIPRDYYVTLHSKQAKDKLTHSGIYGISETISTVEDLLDIDINYYVRVNFTTVIKLVDVLEGIDVHSDYDFARGGYTFKKGNNHIDGGAALVFSRERYSFAAGDNQRVKNQQYVIEAIIKKVLNSTTILTKYTSLLNSLEGSFQTNMEQNDISNLVKDQLSNMSSWTIKNNSLTGTDASAVTYSAGSQKLYVMIPSATSITSAKDKINAILKEE